MLIQDITRQVNIHSITGNGNTQIKEFIKHIDYVLKMMIPNETLNEDETNFVHNNETILAYNRIYNKIFINENFSVKLLNIFNETNNDYARYIILYYYKKYHSIEPYGADIFTPSYFR